MGVLEWMLEEFMQQSVTLIVADDHKVTREGLKAWIKEHTLYRLVAEARTGEEALELTLLKKPHILLLDLMLPDQPGFQVVRALKRHNCETKVIIVSSEDSPPKVELCFKSGASGYLWKGSETSLVLAINTVVAGHEFLDPALRGYGQLESLKPAQLNTLTNEVGLTRRELEILKLTATGFGANEIAEKLNLSVHTVKNHLKAIYAKLEVNGRTEAIHVAQQRGWL